MVGEPAPALQLEEVAGAPSLDLGQMRGRPILLLFYNIGCAGCTGRALPYTLELAGRFPDLQLVAIHSVFAPGAEQPVAQVRAVADYFSLPYPTLFDQGDATFRSFRAEGTPHWVLIDQAGRVHRSFFGSMEGARQRLDYALTELLTPG